MFEDLKKNKTAWIVEAILCVITIIYMIALNSYNGTIFNALGTKELDLLMSLQVLKFPNYATYLFAGFINIFAILLFSWLVKRRCLSITFILVLSINSILVLGLWELLWNPIIRALLIVLVSIFGVAVFEDN